MSNVRRDILMLVRGQLINKQAIEQEIQSLNSILLSAESQDQFCIAHELIDRNRITSKTIKILQAIRYQQLKPFRFLICKN